MLKTKCKPEPSLGIVASCLPILQPVISRVSEITSTLFSWTKNTSQRSLRASSRPLPDHDERPLAKRDAEDRLYPLSSLAETVNEVETDIQAADLEAATWRTGQKVSNHEHTMKVERGYSVNSGVAL